MSFVCPLYVLCMSFVCPLYVLFFRLFLLAASSHTTWLYLCPLHVSCICLVFVLYLSCICLLLKDKDVIYLAGMPLFQYDINMVYISDNMSLFYRTNNLIHTFNETSLICPSFVPHLSLICPSFVPHLSLC